MTTHNISSFPQPPASSSANRGMTSQNATQHPQPSFEQSRRTIQDVTDRALTEMQNREDATVQRLEARLLQYQDMTNLKASSEDLQQAQAEIAVLRRNLEDVKNSKSDAVDRVLALAEQKHEEALKLQERHHIAALRGSNEAATASLAELATAFAKDIAVITQDFRSSLAEMNRNTVVALREVGEGIQASIAATNNLAVSNKREISELSSLVHHGFQTLIGIEEKRALREEVRDTQMAAITNAFTGSLNEVRLVLYCVLYHIY